MKKRVTLDFETRSACELKHAGAFKYSLDPSTQPTCLAFKISGKDRPVHLLDFYAINKPWKDLSENFTVRWRTLIDEGYLFVAQNAFFETVIYKNILVKRYGWPDIPFRQFRCTAAKAAACALPRNLEGAGAALRLTTQKDKRGYVAMMATCKPTKQWNAWRKLQDQIKAGVRISAKRRLKANDPEPPKFLSPEAAPEVWKTLYTYCRIDVKTEELLDDSLPDLMPIEQEIWFLNQQLNWRGLRVDVPTIEKIVKIMEGETNERLQELDDLTIGLIKKPGERKSILEFLALEGIELPDIRAKTVEDALQSGKLTESGRALLEIRKALSKTSTKKYISFLKRAGLDHRVRDILLYCGASTGRDAGTGINPQNFPRGVIKIHPGRPYEPVEDVMDFDAETLKLVYGDNLTLLFSSILRNMILPSTGCELFVADYSKIEVAVLWWLAGNKEGLEILNSGKDPYIYMAAANTGKSYEEIERMVKAEEKWAADARQLGKAQVLGCGFGMGATKFQTTAWDMYRLKLTMGQSKDAVYNYRSSNEAVPSLWKKYEAAAILAISRKGTKFKTGKCSFLCSDQFLWVTLPSGRKLAYREPRLSWRETDYGKQRTIEFLGLAPSKKELRPERTWGGTLTENLVQATARDLMMQALLKLEAAGFKSLLTVHDEIICEAKIGTRSLEEFTKIMCARPSWVDTSLPLDAKGWVGERYRKG